MKKKFDLWVYSHPTLKKLIMELKIAFFIIVISVSNVFATPAYSQVAKVSLNMENKSLEQVMDEIESQSEFYFIFNQKQIDVNRVVNIQEDNKLITDILPELFKGTNVNYTVLDRKILLTTDPLENNLLATASVTEPQQNRITGTATDKNGAPVPGANVVVTGTTQGVITDFDGKYSINVTPGSKSLTFSFIGMVPQEIAIGTLTQINVTMAESAIGLDEVVVVGYGTQRREEVTSSIATVVSKDFNRGAVSQSPLQLVQGKIAGLAISRASGGDPTAGVDMQLRGVSTVRGDASPLVIIDGIPGGNMNTISPEDIASINILRDGSAAAIYGTRGNAGVVIITTKKGTAGQQVINYSSYVYTERWLNKPELVDAAGWIQMKLDFQNSSSALLNSKASSIVDYGANTDWLDEITRSPVSQVHNLSISGGSENTTYYGSVNYRDLQGFLKESSNNILNGRLTITHYGFNKRLSVQMNLSNTFSKAIPVDYNAYRQAMQRNPTLPVYNLDGTFNENAGYDTSNPVGMLLQYDREQKNNEVLASTQISYEIVSGLKLSATGALQRSDQITGYFQHRDAFAAVTAGTNGEAQRTARERLDRTFESNLSYSKLFGGVHSLNVMAGYSYQDFTDEAFGARNRDFITNFFSFNNLGAGLQLPDGKYNTDDVYSNKQSSKLIAFYGRVNYNFDGKYLLSGSLRQEGSTRFGVNNKWGLFPAISAGWTISRESFMANVNFVDELKLRVGFGMTGNQGIGNYLSQQILGNSGVMLYNGKWIPGYAPASNPNPDLRWEKKAETNIGIDAILFNNKLNLTLDIYQRTTRDLLYQYTVPVPPNLYNTMWTNIGEMTNKGIEFSAKVSPVKTNKFVWDLDFNVSYNVNKLVSLSNDTYQTKYQNLQNIGAPGLNDTPAFRLEEGQPIGNFYGYQFAGFTPEGAWLFWNAAHDQQLTFAQVKQEDKAILGNGLPKSYMGLTNTFRYGNFDLTVFLRGVFGFQLLNTQRLFYENRVMVPVNVLTSALTSPVIADPQYSDYYIENGDFVKLDNLTLGYNVPFKGNVVKSLRFYASGQNLLAITGYKGQDPEIRINGLTPGMDYRWQYPSVKTFTLGVNVQF